jgi:hypothetical protein
MRDPLAVIAAFLTKATRTALRAVNEGGTAARQLHPFARGKVGEGRLDRGGIEDQTYREPIAL